MTFKLVLSAVQPDLYEAFKKHFAQFPEVEVVFKPFEQVDFDCVVSAANSFGLMDGGVDQAITDYFGLQMMKRVQQEIISQYYGEQPVGTSMIVRGTAAIEERTNKYVAHTPTMRIPMDVHQTRNVYMAMKAMLIAVEQRNQRLISCPEPMENVIKTVVCPGLGTNTGRVPAEDAAKQMALAYFHVKNPPTAISWYFASQRHNEIVRMEREEDDGMSIDMTQFENLQ
jgi:O-acetyl-ADP-ribose deacetylase (regulator of RNase III)